MHGRIIGLSCVALTLTAACAPTFAARAHRGDPAEIMMLAYDRAAPCLAAAARRAPLRAACAALGNGDGRVEYAERDVDRDGDIDLIVRRQSRMTCGSKGCSTDIYLRHRGGLALAEPRLVTAGALFACTVGGRHGLRAGRAPGLPCFEFRPPRQ